ncbi:MAG: RluA family pseudouridine synthase [Candidatus Moranbacteria bacterium]|nr:RluA family pseudouridine synthase [Candidatus Moranbacteria bacterium]
MGKRIDKFLAEEFFLYSRSEIAEKIKNGEVLVNGKKVKPSYRLEENDQVETGDFSNQQKKLLPNENINLEIIFEDENILAVNKPAGLQVHPSDCKQTDTLTNALVARYAEAIDVHDDSVDAYLRPGIVHRLDKDTSGVMVIAKNKKTFDELKKLFKDRTIEKKYLALVEGVLDEEGGIIDKPLARSAGYSRQLIARENTKTKIRQAVTHYAVLEKFENFSLLEVLPKTGRMHQIRVHLASIGHPIVGDAVYGEKSFKFSVARQLLHAKSLSFDLGGKHWDFEAKMPTDFAQFLAKNKEIN